MLVMPLFEVRNNLPGAVTRAEAGEVVQVTRHGKPAAVLMGQDLYERLLSSAGGVGARLDAWAMLCAESGADEDLYTAFDGLRATDPGRPVELA